jgi:tripartite-type tricarboxylate transporter receptor subunit TctC
MCAISNFLRLFAMHLVAGGVLGTIGHAYPTQPITIVVPSAPGGATDNVARALAEGMRASFSRPVILEHLTGAAGNLALGRVAKATPDGHTVMLGQTSTHVFNGAIYDLPFDLMRDFEPIALIATNPQLIVSNNDVPAKDLRGLITWLQASPGRATMATIGPGSPAHIAGVLFQQITETRFQFIPYRGGGPGMTDLLGGHIDLMIPQPSLAVPHLSTGKIRAYAVTAGTRLGSLPDIPSVDEAGAAGLHISIWQALFAPKGTPKDVIGKLNAAVVAALADPGVRGHFAAMAHEIPPRDQQTPEALRAYQKAEIGKWWPIIRAANIKAP